MLLYNESITFDDVALVPKYSTVKSRLDVDTSVVLGTTHLGKELKLQIPIMSAAMDTITSPAMARAMSHVGALCVLHRYCSVESRKHTLLQASQISPSVVGVSIGLKDTMYDCQLLMPHVALFNLDVAYADNKHVIDYARKFKETFPTALLMVGNVCTVDAVERLYRVGVDIVKISVGSGSVCTTRGTNGFGPGALGCMLDIFKVFQNEHDLKFVLDGGIRSSSDIAKSFAAGAHAVMCGNLLAGTFECPGEVEIDSEGRSWKSFRGMASEASQNDWNGLKNGTVPEGVTTKVPYKGLVIPVLEKLQAGLRSAFSYGGAHTMNEFRGKVDMVRVTPSVQIESMPHILLSGGKSL